MDCSVFSPKYGEPAQDELQNSVHVIMCNPTRVVSVRIADDGWRPIADITGAVLKPEILDGRRLSGRHFPRKPGEMDRML